MATKSTARTLSVDGAALPIGLCSARGELIDATPAALEVLRGLRIVEQLPAHLPRDLWARLDAAEEGEAVEWLPPAAGRLFGCTRYADSAGGFVLLMRELSEKRAALSQRLNRGGREHTGRLIASIAHDIRSSVASIVYSADYLDVSGAALSSETLRESVLAICDASRRLQLTVDGLLDFARLGPTIAVPVSLRDVMSRVQGLLRPLFRDGQTELRVDVPREHEWVRGNPIVIEQIFVQLMLNALESSEDECVVRISARAAPGERSRVRIAVEDDGPGVPDALRGLVFEPFFSTKRDALGLGLTQAREAAVSQEGTLVLERAGRDTCFVVELPRAEEPP